MELIGLVKYFFIVLNFAIIYLLKKGNRPSSENRTKKCVIYLMKESQLIMNILPLLSHLNSMMYEVIVYCEGKKNDSHEIFSKLNFPNVKIIFSENDDLFLKNSFKNNELNAVFVVDSNAIKKIETTLNSLKEKDFKITTTIKFYVVKKF